MVKEQWPLHTFSPPSDSLKEQAPRTHSNKKRALLQDAECIHLGLQGTPVSCPFWTDFYYAPEDKSRNSPTPFALFLTFSSMGLGSLNK